MKILANIIIVASIIIMYGFTHKLPISMQFIFFVLVYAVYIIGYTM